MSIVTHCVKRLQNSKSNFTIEHILNAAGGRQNLENLKKYELSKKEVAEEDKKFEWLTCTRYRPPKLPRSGRKEGVQRRKLGRNPRIPFSSSQVAILEAKFLRTPYLSSSDVTNLASYLKLPETRVKIWFQNRRARERREKEGKPKSRETVQNVQKMESPTGILPPENPECFPLDCRTSFRYITCSESTSYLQIMTPLDLSERQIIYKPK